MSVEDGKDFMEEVRYDLRQIQMRYGTIGEKASYEVPSNDRTKYVPSKGEEQDDEIRQLSELTTTNKVAVAALEGEKPHGGEIVVTSYRPKNKSLVEPVRPIKVIR